MIDSLQTAKDTLIYNEKLSELNPIFIPDPVQFEFVTPGWYILLAVLIVLLFLIGIRIYKKYKSSKYRRDAVDQLKLLLMDIGQRTNSELIEKVSSILKLVSFQSYGRLKTANLSGESWKVFLRSKSSKLKSKNSFDLFNEQYSDSSQNLSNDKLSNFIADSIIWVRSHHV